ARRVDGGQDDRQLLLPRRELRVGIVLVREALEPHGVVLTPCRPREERRARRKLGESLLHLDEERVLLLDVWRRNHLTDQPVDLVVLEPDPVLTRAVVTDRVVALAGHERPEVVQRRRALEAP